MTESVPATTDYVWSFPAAGESVFVLHARGQPMAWLRFEEPGDRATAEWEGRRWRFRHASGLGSPVTIRAAESEAIAAVFTPWLNGGGTVEMASGKRYCWNRKHVFSHTWCFRGDENQSAVCVSQQAGSLAAGGAVTLCPQAAASPDTPLLVLLAWYLRILEFESLSEFTFVCG